MLDKAVSILNCFDSVGGSFRLTELSDRTGLPKATVHRLTADLVRLKLMEKEGNAYRLGGRLFELGSLVPRRHGLRETALPFLQDLYEATHETVHLGVREGREVVYLERIHGHDRLPLPSRVGGRLPLSCTGVGKALLAFSSPELVDTVLGETPLPQLTRYSTSDPDRLRTAIEQAHVSGLAYEEQEAALGVSCIAAPVFDGSGTAVAALSVAVPRARFQPAQLAPAVRTAALGLSRALRADSAERRPSVQHTLMALHAEAGRDDGRRGASRPG
ncbi:MULTISPECIES: IclR family transcriptional regulator [Streptomyces]|uniref:IclR family transcriptional regulator n=1 Tax=Streptomyces hirsutus TaxID=35620 RepID=A0ABZ1GYH8_9ACTN|nr:IclR family transcriptional regulator [Streptomyces hirsutus]WSD11266.1 IclR family transcriptional regulator [Streptomyces hirsutus]WTD22800.1 IclR family transcriptional regulator [Streptomyces hirsutus]WTD79661.1 IclR family transcriptional regulator [Streptomyces sp. NBC_01635]